MRAAVLWLILLAACSGYDDLALLEVESIEPPELEPGATLRIHGHGFPLGQTAEILLSGAVHRPGLRTSKVKMPLVGEVQSESLIEVPIGEGIIEAMGGRATVDGELRVGFRAADGHREVFAAKAVRLDALPDTPSLIRADGEREEQPEVVGGPSFGLEISREELGTVGLRVVSVEPGGLAALQGVKTGDILVGLDGMSLYSWRDFVPDPTKSESTVLVSREGLPGVHALRWPHAAIERVVDPVTLGLFALVGLLLGWLSPAVLCLSERCVRVSLSVWLARLSFLLIFAALLFCISALQWATMGILILGALAALFTLASGDRSGVRSFVLVVGATLTVMLLGRTASMSGLIGNQASPFLRWYIFQSPASSLALAAYLHGIGIMSARPRLFASLYCAVTTVLGATLFLGGWPSAGTAAGIAFLAAKAMAIMVAAHAFQISFKVATTCCGLGLGLAFLGLFVDLSPLFPQWSALAVGCVCALVVQAAIPPLRQESAPALL
jgi:hypothetical protein